MVDTRVGKLLSRWTRTSYLKHSDLGPASCLFPFLFRIIIGVDISLGYHWELNISMDLAWSLTSGISLCKELSCTLSLLYPDFYITAARQCTIRAEADRLE